MIMSMYNDVDMSLVYMYHCVIVVLFFITKLILSSITIIVYLQMRSALAQQRLLLQEYLYTKLKV